MRFVAPQVTEGHITIAEEQEEFKTLVGVPVKNKEYGSVREDGNNTMLLAVRLDEIEIFRLVNGELLYIHLLTYGRGVTPLIVTVGTDELTPWYGVEVAK